MCIRDSSQAVGAVWILHFLTGKKTILRLRKDYMRPEKRAILPVMVAMAPPMVPPSVAPAITVERINMIDPPVADYMNENEMSRNPVSYTHLDVYKRQA